MWCKIDEREITALVNNQVNIYWGAAKPPQITQDHVTCALRRTEKCFEKVKSGYLWNDGEVAFKIEHSVQYSVFLYYLSNTLYLEGNEESASYILFKQNYAFS